jgi:hypothetical protein
MGNNQIPAGGNQLATLAENMIAGLTQLGSTLGITQVSAAGMQTTLDAFTASDNGYNGGAQRAPDGV